MRKKTYKNLIIFKISLRKYFIIMESKIIKISQKDTDQKKNVMILKCYDLEFWAVKSDKISSENPEILETYSDKMQ